MPIDERQLRYESQTKEQFEALGRFVQSFEQMVSAIRHGLEMRLQCESSNMYYFTRMIFHHRALTAQPLWELYRGVVYIDVSEIRPTDQSDVTKFHSTLQVIGKEVISLIEQRNNIIHGTPYIGWASESQDEFSDLSIHKIGVSTKGHKMYVTPKSAQDIFQLVARCERAISAINVTSLAMMTRNCSLLDRARTEIERTAEG